MLLFIKGRLLTSTAKAIFKKSILQLFIIPQQNCGTTSRVFIFYHTWRHLCASRLMACCGSGCGVDLSKEALKQRLTAQQYQVTQEKDTERPFSGKYCKHFEKGIYTCIVCKQELFSSESKYDSKCGWPAFFDSINNSCVTCKDDFSHVSCNLLLLTMKTDMKRKEALCSKCGAHLGHVFDDGPKPTGKRYCINSAALDFRKSEALSVPEHS